jgi:membrane-associated PAP2 superfamily phosphatase
MEMPLGKKTLWISLAALITVLLVAEYTYLDLSLQKHLYLPLEKTWVLKDPGLKWRAIFYHGIKIPIYILGGCTLIATIISFTKNLFPRYRKGLLIVTLSLIILPGGIALIGKNLTNVQCPDDLNHFAGKIPYVKLFEHYPLNPNSPDGKWPRGKCFPAGHASGGFALLSLVCLFRTRRNKVLAFILAMSMGWTMGLYQMLRGAHFLSHQLTTMILAFILVSSLNLLIKDFDHESIKA